MRCYTAGTGGRPGSDWLCQLDADDVAAAELGLPAGRYVGSQVYFGTEGDGLRIFLGVTDDRGLNDIGELTGAVRYDGQTLSLNPAELTYQEIA